MKIEIKRIRAIRIALSVLLIINGAIWFLGHLGKLNAINLVYSILMVTAGFALILWFSSFEKIIIAISNDSLLIKWHGRVMMKSLLFKDIESIYLRKVAVVIIRKKKKKLKYNLDNLEVSQKKELYEYFIKLSETREINVVRRFED